MKKIRFVTVATLTTLLVSGGVSAFANEVRDVETEGQVTFVPNDENITIVDPTEPGPDVVIPPVGPEGQTGPLTIAYAPTMAFGSQVISNRDMSYNLVAEMQQLAGTVGEENQVPYVSFAQVQDTRGNNAGWDLSVILSTFESGTQNNELRGARIEFVSPRLQYNGNNQENAPTIHEAGLMLDAGGARQNVLTATTGKGAGTSSVVWGNQAALDEQFADDEIEIVENDGIKLHVPGATAKDAAVYVATLTWNLTAGVGAGGETIPGV